MDKEAVDLAVEPIFPKDFATWPREYVVNAVTPTTRDVVYVATCLNSPSNEGVFENAVWSRPVEMIDITESA